MSPLLPATVNLELVRNAYERAAATSKKSPLPFDQVLSQPLDQHYLRMHESYTSRLLATKEESAQGHMFINGKYFAFGGVSLALSFGWIPADKLALDSYGPV